jgi:ParB family chromosome partitioning protein
MTDLPNKYQEGNLYKIPTELLLRDANQPRKHFDPDALNELADSIKRHGVLEPVLFRVDDKGNLVLISGERRWRAAKQAKLAVIPAIYTEGPPAEIALVENLLRENLTPVEEAEALLRMVDEFGYTQQQLADALGKGRSTIAEVLSIARLPALIRDECREDPKCPRRVLIEIAKQKKTPKGMLSLFRKYQAQGMTSDQVRKETRTKRAPVDKSLRIKDSITDLTASLRNSTDLSAEDLAGLQPLLVELSAVVNGLLPQCSSTCAAKRSGKKSVDTLAAPGALPATRKSKK